MTRVEMILKDMIEDLELEVKSARNKLTNKVTGVYVSDLLSDVIANAQEGQIWITLQIHPNIVAVASLKELSGIILVNNRLPESETIQKAEEVGIPLMMSKLTTFALAGRLYRRLAG